MTNNTWKIGLAAAPFPISNPNNNIFFYSHVIAKWKQILIFLFFSLLDTSSYSIQRQPAYLGSWWISAWMEGKRMKKRRENCFCHYLGSFLIMEKKISFYGLDPQLCSLYDHLLSFRCEWKSAWWAITEKTKNRGGFPFVIISSPQDYTLSHSIHSLQGDLKLLSLELYSWVSCLNFVR